MISEIPSKLSSIMSLPVHQMHLNFQALGILKFDTHLIPWTIDEIAPKAFPLERLLYDLEEILKAVLADRAAIFGIAGGERARSLR